MSFITPMRMVFAAWARDRRGSAVTAAAAPGPSNPRRVISLLSISRFPVVGRAILCRPALYDFSPGRSAPHERAAAFAQGAEGFFRRRRLQQLVVVPWRFGFGRSLHLEQVGGMDLAAILTNPACP